jgi:hypothetical protein
MLLFKINADGMVLLTSESIYQFKSESSQSLSHVKKDEIE